MDILKQRKHLVSRELAAVSLFRSFHPAQPVIREKRDRDWGAEPITCPIVKDRYEDILAAVQKAVEECDMVILNAGSSAGWEDYSCAVIEDLGTVLYHHGIAMKPGKPAILGPCGAKPVPGVPVYPVSGILVIEEFYRPLIQQWTENSGKKDGYLEAVLIRPVVSGLKYQEFVRVRLGYVGEKLTASPLNRGSGVVTSFMKADGILEVPQETEGYEAGETVRGKLLTAEENSATPWWSSAATTRFWMNLPTCCTAMTGADTCLLPA